MRILKLLAVVVFRVGWLAIRLALRKLACLLRRHRQTFGSARFASSSEIHRAGLLRAKGLIVAKLGRRLLRFPGGEGAVIVFAPTGAGKGVGPVISNLLDYAGSVIATDPKGENVAITGRYRASLGAVWRLDLENPEFSDLFNPMDLIRLGTAHETDDAEALANLMLDHDSHRDSHWRRKAVSWLSGFILFVVLLHRHRPELRTLAEVHRIATADREMLIGFMGIMARIPHPKLKETAGEILRALDVEETSNILSNVIKGTEPWSLAKPLGVLSTSSSFNPLTFASVPQTLYLVVPEEKLATYGPALRVIVGSLMRAVVRAGHEAPTLTPPLFLLDECAALGYLEPLESGMGYLRAYARAMLIFQDLDQLQRTYPKWRSMLANSAAQLFWGVNDMETAKLVAERIGMTTVRTNSQGMSQGHADLVRHQVTSGVGEAGRYLIDPSEILRMPQDKVLLFLNRHVAAPIRARRVRYYEEPLLKGRFDRWRAAVAGCAEQHGVISRNVGSAGPGNSAVVMLPAGTRFRQLGAPTIS